MGQPAHGRVDHTGQAPGLQHGSSLHVQPCGANFAL